VDNKPKKLQKQLNADGSITFKDSSTNDVYDFYGKKIAEGNLGEKKRVAKKQYIDEVRKTLPERTNFSDAEIEKHFANQPERLQQLEKQVEDTYIQQFPTPDIATLKYNENVIKEAQDEEFKTNPIKKVDYTDYLNKIEDAYELRHQKDQNESILYTAKTEEDFNSDWYKQAKSKVDAIDENIVHNRIKANKQFADDLFQTNKRIADELGYIPLDEEAKNNPSALDYALAYPRGFNNIFSGTLKGIALWGTKFDQLFQDMFQTGKTLDYTQSPTYKLGQLIETKRFDQTTKPDFAEHLVEGLGSMTGFVLGGRMFGGVRGSIGTLGGLSQTESGYAEAKSFGANETSALQSALYNFAIGLSEEIPLEKFMHRLGKFKDLSWRELFRGAMVSGSEEMIQESMSQLLQNVTAKELYDANRELSEGVFQGGAIGLVSGFLMHGASNIGGNLINRRVAELQAKIEAENELKKNAAREDLIKIFDERIKFYESQIKEEQEYIAKNNDLLTATQKVASMQVDNIANQEVNKFIIDENNIRPSDKIYDNQGNEFTIEEYVPASGAIWSHDDNVMFPAEITHLSLKDNKGNVRQYYAEDAEGILANYRRIQNLETVSKDKVLYDENNNQLKVISYHSEGYAEWAEEENVMMPGSPEELTLEDNKGNRKTYYEQEVSEVLSKLNSNRLNFNELPSIQSDNQRINEYSSSDYFKSSKETINHSDVLTKISEQSTNPLFKELAVQLSKVVSNTKVEYQDVYDSTKYGIPLQKNERLPMIHDFENNKIIIHNDQINSKQSFEEAYLHETIHSLTRKGLRDDAVFREIIQDIFDVAISKSKGLKEYFDNYNGGKSQLDEFLAHAFSDIRVQKVLSQIYREDNGLIETESMFDKFIKAIKNFLFINLAVDVKDNSLLEEIIKNTEDYLGENFEIKQSTVQEAKTNVDKSYSRNIANTDIENEFQRTNETNNTVSNGLNSNGNVPPRNAINEMGINAPQKLYNLPSVVQNFVNSQGIPIFNSIEDALETVNEIYAQAEDNIKQGNTSYSKEREALQIWKDSFTGNNVLEQYSGINIHSLSNLEELNKMQKEKNGQDYLEFIWHNLRNKVNSSVYVLNEDGKLIKSDYSYEESGSRKSTVRDKRQWQVYQEWFASELGLDFEVNELRITDAIAKVETNKLQEFYYNLDKQLFEQGLIAIYNEKENLVFKIDSIKDKSGSKYDVQSMSMEDIIVDWTNTYWKSLLGDIGMSKLTKRLTAVTGEAANNLITDAIVNEIGYDSSRAIYLETNKDNQETGRVIVNTGIFDTNTISQTIKDSFPNWKKDMLADGAEFELQIVHDTYNNLNGVDFTDRGMASKSKTIIPGKALFKSARFVVISGSPLHQFMIKNNIGRLTVNSALKIDNGYSNVDHLDWKTIEQNGFIDSAKHIFKHDIIQDGYLSSHGKVKNRAKGTLASFMTTSLSAFANKEYRPALEKHLETHLADLQDYMTKVKDNNFMATELKEFIASQTDGYRTYLMDFLENQDLTDSPEFVEEPSIVNFFLRNILTSKIEDTLSHQEKGAYPALYPDLGPLTGFSKMKDVNPDAFDQYGFIKPGFFLLDKMSAQKNGLKMSDKALVGCNPPASIADLRGLTMAGATPNKLNSSETSLENERGSRINTNYLVVNNEQFVGNSGKDFDIDKVIVVKINTPELETIWKNTLENDARLKQILDSFNAKYRGDTYLEKLQTIFGRESASINLDNYSSINHFNKLLQTMEIGRVYNIKMYYQAVLEATNNGKTNLEWTEKDDEGFDHKYVMIVNKENINSNLAILYHLTNMALDWQSNQDLFKIDYTPVKLAGHLTEIYRDGKKLSQEVVTKKGFKIYPAGSAFYNLARTNLKPLRDLLRFQTDEQDKPKMKVLFEQMKAAKEVTDQEDNTFKDTTLFKSVKYFIDNFKVDNFGHNFKDIVQLLTNLKNDLVGKEDLNDLGYAQNKTASRTAKLGEFFNKVFALTLSPKSGYYTTDKALNPFGLINNTDNTFTLYQIHSFSKQFPFLNNFYSDLLTDLFDKKLFEINAKATKKEVYWRTIGKTSNAKFFVTPLQNNNLEFRKEDYNNGKLTGTKTYQSFKQMLDDQSGHTLRNAIKDSDGFSQKDLTDVFKFTNNRRLGDNLNNQLFKKIVEFSEKESSNWTARELELLYKSLFGVYDYKFNPADKTGKGYDNSLKSRLMGLQIGEPLVYTDKVTNIEDPITGEILDTKVSAAIINNKFPAFRALQQVALLDNPAGQIGKQVLDNVISTYNNQLKSLHIQDNDLPSIQKAEDVVGQNEIKLDTVTKSFEQLLSESEHYTFEDYQVSAYFKKAENQVTQQDRVNYLLNQVQEAYGFLETKIGSSPTSQEVSKFLIANYNKANQEASNVVLSAIYVREKLYDQQVKDYSNKNLTYTQNQDSVVSVFFQGKRMDLNLGDILSDFRIYRMANEPARISGAMIDYSSRQAVDRKYRTISEDITELYFNIPSLFQSDSKADTDLLNFEGNVLQSQKLQKLIFQISEQKDGSKILKDLKIENGVFNYKGIVADVFSTSGIDDSPSKRTKLDIAEILKLSEHIYNDRMVENRIDKDKSDYQYNKSLYIRAIGASLVNRYIADYYVPNLLENHLKDLNAYAEQANGLVDSEMKVEILNSILRLKTKAENYYSNYINKASELDGKGIRYMPHNFYNEAMIIKGLVSYYTEKGMSQEVAESKSMEMIAEMKKEKDNVFNYLGLASEHNFEHRELDFIDSYSHSLSEIYNYANDLVQFIHGQNLQVLENLNKRYLTKESTFMKRQRDFMAAITRNKTVGIQEVEFNKINKNDYIMFIQKSKGNYFDKVGRIVSINKKTGIFEIEDMNGERHTFSKFESIRFRKAFGITLTKKFVIATMGSEVSKMTDENMAYLVTTLVNARAKMLLGFDHIWFGARNYMGGRINLWSQFGSISAASDLFTKYEKLVENPNLFKKSLLNEFLKVLVQNRGAIGGDITNAIERTGGVIESTGKYLSPNTVEYLNKSTKQWKATKASLADLERELKSLPEDINWEKASGLKEKIKFNMDRIDDFYKRHNLSNVVFGTLEKSRLNLVKHWNAALVEKEIRGLTAVVAANRVLDIFSEQIANARTEAEKKLIKDYALRLAGREIIKAINNTQFDYKKGFKTSTRDSTYLGKPFTQFRHYAQSQLSTYITGMENMFTQFNRFGFINVVISSIKKDSDLSYDVTISDGVNKATINLKDQNELAILYRRTFANIVSSIIMIADKALSITLFGYLGSSAISKAIELLFIGQVAGSVNYSTVSMVLQAGMYWLGMMFDSIVYDDDEDKEKKFKKILALIGEDETEWSKRTIDKARNKIGNSAYEIELKDLHEQYNRELLKKFQMTIPLGIGESQLVEILGNAIINHTAPTNEMWLNFGRSVIPGLNLLSTINTSLDSPLYNTGRNPIDTKVSILKKENKRIKELTDKKDNETISPEEETELDDLKSNKSDRISTAKDKIPEDKKSIYESITKEEAEEEKNNQKIIEENK
jgi:RNAse (barnase) inhibitor barstar